MNKNITLSIDDTLLRKAKYSALEHDMSLSKWVKELIIKTLSKENDYKEARKSALKHLKKGYPLGGSPLTREQIYER